MLARRIALAATVALLVVPATAAADGGTLSHVSISSVVGASSEPAQYVGPWGDNQSIRWLDDAVFSSNHWFLRTPLAEGQSAYFTTSEPLIPEDTDNQRDLYRRKGTRTELVSIGNGTAATPGNFCGGSVALPACPFATSRDTEHAFFSFDGPLVPEDTDGAVSDLFERFGDATTLVSTGPAGTNGPYEVCSNFGSPCPAFAVSADGSRVVFQTKERLVPEDYDFDCNESLSHCLDLYERSNGVTRLLSTGPLRSAGSQTALSFQMAELQFYPFPVSEDARHVFFMSEWALVPEDGDTRVDLYESFDGITRLVSTGPFNSNSPVEGHWGGASADGTRAFFTMNESLTSDSALGSGIYERVGGTTRRLPLGPPGDRFNTASVRFHGPSYDGTHVFFSTTSRMVAEDTDGRGDLYSWSDEDGVQLVSTGPAGGNGAFDVCSSFGPCIEAASRDGKSVYFTTREPLVGADSDTACPVQVGVPSPCEDIYARDLSTGTTRLVSTGPGLGDGVAFDPLFLDAISADGSRAFFRTRMALVPEDTDRGSVDLYERFAGHTRLLSTGPLASNGPTDVEFGGSTADGRIVYFDTAEGLMQGDGDNQTDVYRVDVNEAPDCSGVSVSRPVLTTANRHLVPVTLDGATDPDRDQIAVAVDGVTQDEPVRSSGDGTSPDAALIGDGDLRIRAERNPRGDGRVYRIAFTATDDHGGSCSGATTVSVPRKSHRPAVDSAPPSYDSLGR